VEHAASGGELGRPDDHVWFLNRGVAALPIELVAEGDPSPALCCVRGPELIEVDQRGNVVNAWGGPKFHPKWLGTSRKTRSRSKSNYIVFRPVVSRMTPTQLHSRGE
jgi:hypothetical protein